VTADLRVAVLTDVHGNLQAIEAVLADIDAHGPYDRLIAGGDYCLNGPDPATAFDLIASRASILVKGNTDRDIVERGLSDPDLGQKKRASIVWTRDQIGEQRVARLDALGFRDVVVAPDGSTLLVVHANPRDFDRHIFPDMPDDELAELIGGVEADILAFGHLHIPYVRDALGVRLYNLAACGLPRDGDQRAVWGSFEWSARHGWHGQIHRTRYDIDTTVERIYSSGMPNPDKRAGDLIRATYD
jgi:predicted phosphodiesterase